MSGDLVQSCEERVKETEYQISCSRSDRYPSKNSYFLPGIRVSITIKKGAVRIWEGSAATQRRWNEDGT